MSKTPKQSAGLLMFRRVDGEVEIFLVHPGGPYWAQKNEGAWTIPKGEYEVGEEPLAAARREFHEETGFDSIAPFVDLGRIRQKSGKVVVAWAFEGNCDPATLVSNTCEIEWPPRSAKRILIPEVDRGAWFSLEQAAIFLREEQRPLLIRLRQPI
jgi:predicted NUDIX family NTP pyrophosphohydrolase